MLKTRNRYIITQERTKKDKMDTQHCKRCKRDLPKDDFFRDRKHWKQCNVCTAKKLKSTRLWREKGGREYEKKWQAENKEKCREKQRRYKLRNPNKSKEYYEDNKEIVLQKQKKYRDDNKEKVNKKTKRWMLANLDKHKCEHCEYTSAYSRAIDLHTATKHIEIKDIVCSFEDCEYSCADERLLKKHIHVVHNKKFQCDHEGCDHIAGNIHNLKVHMTTHSDECNFNCNNCKFKTKTKGNLYKHKQICTGELHCSSGEYEIMKVLDKMGFEYQYNSTYELKDIRLLKWDFIINTGGELDDPIFIEFDGRQHFEPIEYFGGEATFLKQQEHDKLKNQYCKENNYLLLRIPYTQFGNISQIITDFMCKHTDWGHE